MYSFGAKITTKAAKAQNHFLDKKDFPNIEGWELFVSVDVWQFFPYATCMDM